MYLFLFFFIIIINERKRRDATTLRWFMLFYPSMTAYNRINYFMSTIKLLNERTNLLSNHRKSVYKKKKLKKKPVSIITPQNKTLLSRIGDEKFWYRLPCSILVIECFQWTKIWVRAFIWINISSKNLRSRNRSTSLIINFWLPTSIIISYLPFIAFGVLHL